MCHLRVVLEEPLRLVLPGDTTEHIGGEGGFVKRRHANDRSAAVKAPFSDYRRSLTLIAGFQLGIAALRMPLAAGCAWNFLQGAHRSTKTGVKSIFLALRAIQLRWAYGQLQVVMKVGCSRSGPAAGSLEPDARTGWPRTTHRQNASQPEGPDLQLLASCPFKNCLRHTWGLIVILVAEQKQRNRREGANDLLLNVARIESTR